MGKKSNAKKIIRELLEEKEGKLKKNSKKQLKRELKKSKNVDAFKEKNDKPKKKGKSKPKKSAKKEKKIQVDHKKLMGGALTAIMVVILIAVGYLLFQRAFRAVSIAKLLPADHTIATLEINTNFEHNQLIKTFKLLENYPQYSQAELIKRAELYLNLNYRTDLKPWLGRNVGAAMVKSQSKEGLIYTLIFAEFLNRVELDKFLDSQNPSKNEYSGYTTYLIGEGSYLTVIDDYLFISPDQQAIYELIDVQVKDIKKLYTEEYFRKIDNNLPLNKIAYFYLNFDQINEGFFQNFAFLSKEGLTLEMLQPFLKIFDAEGAAIVATEDNFALQTFVSLDESVYASTEYLNFQAKYSGNLSNYLSTDLLVFWGGENLEYQLKRFVELLAGNSESALLLFDSLVESYTEKYFGSDINFKEDILPLFANEFALVLEESESKIHYKLLIELDNPQSDAIKIHELANNFASIGAIFEPKIIEHVLEDGTVGKEIIAVSEEIQKTEVDYSGEKIYELQLGNQGGIYYTILEDIAVVSTSKSSVMDTIELVKDNSSSLKNSEIFKKNISPVLKSSDEISYFNIEALLPILFEDSEIPEFLNIFSSLSSGRNYFNDGIVTINYLQVK